MQRSEKVLQIAYAISIAWLISTLMANIADLTHLENLPLFFFLGGVGAILLVLGLFKFQKGLGAGLALAGLSCVLWGSAPYLRELGDNLRFVLAFGMLIIVGYALYRLQRQEQGK
ncbi:MAG: hypothetical protein WC747_02800 [Candidatus Babeliales bacterium]|jgi:hypothetical protein